jgi:Flp pilus assembly pilin Flp
MRELFHKLLKDERGIIISSEVVLVGTILVIGSLVGLAALSNAINHELNDVANAVSARSDFGDGQDWNGDNYYSLSSSEGVTEVAGY